MKNDSPKIKASLSDNKPDETCEWYINSPEHKNCFWLYIYSISKIDGSMHEHVQTEISKLLGWSNTKTHLMLKQAMTELEEAMKLYEAKDLTGEGLSETNSLPSFQLKNKYKNNDFDS